MRRRSTIAREKRKETFRKTTNPTNPKKRLGALLGFFVILGAGCIAVLFDLQMIRADDLQEEGESQRLGNRLIAGNRGAIVDRNGFALASTSTSYQLTAAPVEIADKQKTAEILAPLLDKNPKEVQALLEGDGPKDKYSLLDRTVPEEIIEQVRILRDSSEVKEFMVGIHIQTEEDRAYSSENLALPLVGRVDRDERGIFGIEESYNNLMAGAGGIEKFERGRFGSISVGSSSVTPARQGFDVVLTIDHRLQHMAEKTLVEHCQEQQAKGASLVLSSPDTGEILAMASVERPQEGAACAVSGYNKALAHSYEPGSVVKPIVLAAAVEELGYRKDSTVEVPSSIVVGGRGFSDDPAHPTATFPISQIMEDSMNVGTIILAGKVGDAKVYDYLKEFGIGENSDLGFKSESRGALRHHEEWWGSDSGSIPIGYGLSVNILQLSTAYNVFANGGVYQKPTLIKSLQSPEGKDLLPEPEKREQIVTSETAMEVSTVLTSVVANGTGKAAAIEGYEVAGKTGTARKVFDDGSGKHTYGEPGNRRYVTTFAGFAPADDPVFTLVVTVDEPKVDTSASKVAAPIFSEVGEYALLLSGIPSSYEGVASGERKRSKPAGIIEVGEVVDDNAKKESEIAE